MSRIKYLFINKLDNGGLLILINRGLYENSRDTIHIVCDVLVDRVDCDVLIKSMAANYSKVTLNKLYKYFTIEVWLYYIRYHAYYLMPEHVKYMPEQAQKTYKDTHTHTFYAIMSDGSEKNIEAARYVDYLLGVSSKG